MEKSMVEDLLHELASQKMPCAFVFNFLLLLQHYCIPVMGTRTGSHK